MTALDAAPKDAMQQASAFAPKLPSLQVGAPPAVGQPSDCCDTKDQGPRAPPAPAAAPAPPSCASGATTATAGAPGGPASAGGSGRSSPLSGAPLVRADELTPHLRCGLCREPAAGALVLSCGHLFCGCCLADHLLASPACPACHMALRAIPVRCVSLDHVVTALLPALPAPAADGVRRRRERGESAPSIIAKMLWWLEAGAPAPGGATEPPTAPGGAPTPGMGGTPAGANAAAAAAAAAALLQRAPGGGGMGSGAAAAAGMHQLAGALAGTHLGAHDATVAAAMAAAAAAAAAAATSAAMPAAPLGGGYGAGHLGGGLGACGYGAYGAPHHGLGFHAPGLAGLGPHVGGAATPALPPAAALHTGDPMAAYAAALQSMGGGAGLGGAGLFMGGGGYPMSGLMGM